MDAQLAPASEAVQAQAKPGINLFEIMRDYVESMLSEQPGRKALILDRQTLGKCFFPLYPMTLLNPFLFPYSDRLHDLLSDLNPPERSLLH